MFFFIWIIATVATMSNNELDSLSKKLKELPATGKNLDTDTLRASLLCKISRSIIATNPDSSFSLLNIAEQICKYREWHQGHTNVLYSRGFNYMSIGQYMKATEYLYKGLILAEKTNNLIMVAKCGSMLGISYSKLKYFKEAKHYLGISISIFQKINQPSQYLNNLNYMGIVLLEEKKYYDAIKYFSLCYEKNKNLNFPGLSLYALTNIGICQKKLNQYQNALKTFSNVKSQEESINGYPVYDRVFTLASLADIYLNLKQFSTAQSHLNEAILLNEKGGTNHSSSYLYEIAYKYFKATKHYDKALIFFEKYRTLEEKIKLQNNNRDIENLKYEYENEKSELKLKNINQEYNQELRLRKIAVGSIIILLLSGCILGWNHIQLKRKNLFIQQQRQEIVNINKDLEELNYNLEKIVENRTHDLKQANFELIKKNDEILLALVEGQTLERKRVAVELHDNLGAMISAMRWRLQILNRDRFTEKEQKVYDGILDMMGTAYSEIRLISHNLLPIELENKGLKGALEKLVNDINLGDKLHLSLHIEQKDIPEDKRFQLEIYSICLELVNNVIKHSKANRASIHIYKENDKLKVSVSDNGVGFDHATLSSGIGLKNIQNRVNANHGTLYIASDTNNITSITCYFTIGY